MMVWVAGMLFCVDFLVGMSVMEVVLIMVVMIGLVIMVVCMYVSIVRHISGHLMVMDPQSHGGDGSPPLRGRGNVHDGY